MKTLSDIYVLLRQMTEKNVNEFSSHFDVPIKISIIFTPRPTEMEVLFKYYEALVTISFSCYQSDDHARIEAKVRITKSSNWNEIKVKEFDSLTPIDFLVDSNPELKGFFDNMFTYIIFWAKNA